MNFYRGMITIATKELRHLIHDRYTLVLTLVLPVFTLVIFGYALDTRVRDVPTVVEDLDGGAYSQSLIADFSKSQVFRLISTSNQPENLLDRLRRGDVKVGIQIPRGYSAAVFYGKPTAVRIWVDGSDAVVSGQTAAEAQAIGARHAVQIALSGTPIDHAPAQYDAQILFNPKNKSANYFVPALIRCWLKRQPFCSSPCRWPKSMNTVRSISCESQRFHSAP